jgi:hypothetical protein
MPRFRTDNTAGYSDTDLAALNEAFETVVINNHDPDAHADGYYESDEYKSWEDWVAEQIQADFDASH